MNKTKYTVDYFIEKFSRIPESEIGEADINKHCALWHLGVREGNTKTGYVETKEAKALGKILATIVTDPDLRPVTVVWYINDDHNERYVKGSTPKQRILNALKKAKTSKP